MQRLYNGQCQGALDLMKDRLWQMLHSHPDDGETEIEGDALEEE